LPADPHTQRVALTFDDGPHPEYTPALLRGC
jgi:peptidoglycan/xylan/chitin deacetylase (PgdA/CDA1 family)